MKKFTSPLKLRDVAQTPKPRTESKDSSSLFMEPPKTQPPKGTPVVPRGQPSMNSKGDYIDGKRRVRAPKSVHLVVSKHVATSRYTRFETEEGFEASPSILLTDPLMIYEFKLSKTDVITTSAGGIANNSFNNDPSAISEFGTLSSLFSLCRLVDSQIKLLRCLDTATPTTVSVGAFHPLAYNILGDDAGAPGSYAGVLDSPNAKVWSYAFDSSPYGTSLSLSFRGQREPLWADVTTPYSATLYQGCPGNAQVYGDSLPASLQIAFVVQFLTIQFTNRM